MPSYTDGIRKALEQNYPKDSGIVDSVLNYSNVRPGAYWDKPTIESRQTDTNMRILQERDYAPANGIKDMNKIYQDLLDAKLFPR